MMAEKSLFFVVVFSLDRDEYFDKMEEFLLSFLRTLLWLQPRSDNTMNKNHM